MSLINNVSIDDKCSNCETNINFTKLGNELTLKTDRCKLLNHNMNTSSIKYYNTSNRVLIILEKFNMVKMSYITSGLGFDVNDMIVSFFDHITQENEDFSNYATYIEPDNMINCILMYMGIDSSVTTLGEYLTFTYNKLTGSDISVETFSELILNGMTGFNDTSIVYMNENVYTHLLTMKKLNKSIEDRDVQSLPKHFFNLDINPCLFNWFKGRDKNDGFFDVNIISNTFNLILLNHIFNKEIKDIFNTHDSSHIKFKRDGIIEFYGTRENKDSDIKLLYIDNISNLSLINQISETSVVGIITKTHDGIKFEIECESKYILGSYDLPRYSKIFNLTTKLLSFMR